MKKVLLLTVGAAAAAFLIWYAFMYFATYSEGTRAGELIRLSKRGVVFKTWEGEVSQGVAGAQLFKFSVLDGDKAAIDSLQKYQGQYVKVTYVERYRTFSWWGETRFFVTAVQKQKSPFNLR